MGMVRSMLKGKKLPNFLWAEGVATAIHILNRSPTKAVEKSTPMQAWTGEIPDVSKFRVFGSIAYKHVYAHVRQKLDDRSQKMIMVGYSTQSPSNYRLLNPLTRKLEASHDVTIIADIAWTWEENGTKDIFDLSFADPFPFNEEEDGTTSNESDHSTSSQHLESPTTHVSSTFGSSSERMHTPSHDMSPANQQSTPYSPNLSSQASSSTHTPINLRPLADIYATTQPLEQEDFLQLQFALNVADPLCYEDAVQEKTWQIAITEEIAAIERNDTWEMVSLPPGKNLVGLKWLFKTKYGANGQVIKHKARLVAKGYSQKKGVDFEETFAPVARFETIRIVLAVAAQKGWLIHQLDVKSAFLNRELEEDIFVEQPEGYQIQGCEDKVLKLKKALYGLKQAPRTWYAKIDGYFTKNGYQRSLNEPTLYVKQTNCNNIIYVLLYVDDIICTSSSDQLIANFKQGMQEVFEMTDMGSLQYFLGLEVKQSSEGIFISQEKYAKGLLDKFQMRSAKPEGVPMSPYEKLVIEDGES
jgi:hypothetical protein